MFGYTQKQIAKMLNIHNPSQIAQWEKGSQMPNAKNVFMLSLIYRTFPNSLYPEYFSELKEIVRIKEEQVLAEL